MDSCSLFLFLSTFLGGYDLYIISTEYYPLKLERATGPEGRSCEYFLKDVDDNIIIFFTVTSLYGYEGKIAIICRL